MKILFLIFITTICCNLNYCKNPEKETPERIWWNNLNDTWQEVFLRELDMIGKKPSNEDLIRIINLEQVDCDHYPLGDSNLEPLQKLKRLKSLSVGSTYISNIEALNELDSLEFVNLAATAVEDISPLRHHHNLESVYIQQTRVRDLAPLAGCKRLQVIVFSETDVRSIIPVMELPLLSIFIIPENKIPDAQVKEFKLKHPECEVD